MNLCDQIILGHSEPILKIKELIRRVATSDLNVVICGETGVGKELVAKALHLMSDRQSKPFIKVNCAAIPGQLLESELFGYERGAFTGAEGLKIGKFELAHKGTIFLDEIGDMPLSLQAKMLQVLQDFQFSRLGSKTDVRVDCWVLSATNQDLEKRVSEGLFREDLYYRLNIIRICVPPLRERPADIEPLIRYFAGQFAGKSRYQLSEDGVLDFLLQYSWPGNVRELKSVVKRLMVLGDWEALRSELQVRELKDSRAHVSETKPAKLTINEVRSEIRVAKNFPSLKCVKKKAIQEAESRLICAVLQKMGWNRKRTAEVLKISYKALLYKIKEYGLAEAESLD